MAAQQQQAAPSPLHVDTMSSGSQFREFLSQYNKITEQCFMACIHDFTSRRIISAENSCALNCLEKYMKMTNRISLRFQEHQLIANDALAAAHKSS
ncbi:mitochondrial import inner membrane translocase subunit Tim9 [Biomphalaria pfeifferi]|uniref:Mitochondrial import inner membrane translocase subunit n=1 Tax=Biomphalaria pfeifferi TaxID=112525 RepID=A0AAD8AVP4_BIOPF|nr:mitochondrial import inner membrane translocase subunit Tim9 [Biomphalaria pfeifferi]